MTLGVSFVFFTFSFSVLYHLIRARQETKHICRQKSITKMAQDTSRKACNDIFKKTTYNIDTPPKEKAHFQQHQHAKRDRGKSKP